MGRLTVEECHQTGGRLAYVNDRPVCVLPTGDGEEVALDMETRQPIGGPVPVPGGAGGAARAGLAFYVVAGVAALAMLVGRRRR